ncbi:MAG: hypothetical protein ACI9JN_000118 [Bacteroidia bacterium]
MVAGILSDTEQFGSLSVFNEKGHRQFLGKFTGAGSYTWIKQFNSSVRRIKSDKQGIFYVCGNYNQNLFVGDSVHQTTENYDFEGFLLQLSDSVNWIRTLGMKGVVQYGYRTSDVMSDIAFDSVGNPCVLTMIEWNAVPNTTVSVISGVVMQYDEKGNLLDSIPIVTSLTRGGVACLNINPKDEFVVSGMEQTLANGAVVHQGFLYTFNRLGKLIDQQKIEHEKNFMFRSSFTNESGTVYTGHYKTRLQINDSAIKNDGNHGLFMYRP